MELPFDVKKDAVLFTLKYVMKFWNLYHAGCGSMPRETWDMSQCVGQIHAFLMAGQRKNIFFFLHPINTTRDSVVFVFFSVIRVDGTYTEFRIS